MWPADPLLSLSGVALTRVIADPLLSLSGVALTRVIVGLGTNGVLCVSNNHLCEAMPIRHRRDPATLPLRLTGPLTVTVSICGDEPCQQMLFVFRTSALIPLP